jgi:hypothetical protein
MDDLPDILARLRGAWMAGGLAQKHCPADWAATVGAGPGAELALAALAGHALQTVFRPVPSAPLGIREPLPALALPPAADALRPRIRRLLAAHHGLLRPFLIFLAARGVSMHPADWLPAKREDRLPILYGPWAAWVNGGDALEKRAVKPRVADPALAAELAEMLVVATEGLLRRHKRLRIEKLKTAPQTARRLELFGLVPLSALAAALGVPETELVARAPAGAETGISAFTAAVAATGTQAQQRTLFAAILDDEDCPLAAARPVGPSLTRSETAAFLPRLLQREDSPGFELAVELAGEALGQASFAALAGAPGFAALSASTGETENKATGMKLGAGLAALGLLAAPPAAQQIIEIYLGAGLSPADPKLDMLYLNTELTPEASA